MCARRDFSRWSVHLVDGCRKKGSPAAGAYACRTNMTYIRTKSTRTRKTIGTCGRNPNTIWKGVQPAEDPCTQKGKGKEIYDIFGEKMTYTNIRRKMHTDEDMITPVRENMASDAIATP
eukprot:515629-Amorphochlora_amoeboformis.AAC.1